MLELLKAVNERIFEISIEKHTISLYARTPLQKHQIEEIQQWIAQNKPEFSHTLDVNRMVTGVQVLKFGDKIWKFYKR